MMNTTFNNKYLVIDTLPYSLDLLNELEILFKKSTPSYTHCNTISKIYHNAIIYFIIRLLTLPPVEANNKLSSLPKFNINYDVNNNNIVNIDFNTDGNDDITILSNILPNDEKNLLKEVIMEYQTKLYLKIRSQLAIDRDHILYPFHYEVKNINTDCVVIKEIIHRNRMFVNA